MSGLEPTGTCSVAYRPQETPARLRLAGVRFAYIESAVQNTQYFLPISVLIP